MEIRKLAILGATGNIGRVLTAELLRNGHHVRAVGRDAEKLKALKAQGAEVFAAGFDNVGPRQLTLREAARILGDAIGRPGLKYVQLSEEDEEKAMLGAGMKPSIVQALVEMHRGFNEGLIVPAHPFGVDHMGSNRSETFAQEFADAYRKQWPQGARKEVPGSSTYTMR